MRAAVSFKGLMRPYTKYIHEAAGLFIIIFMRPSFFKCFHEVTVPFIVLRSCSFFLIWGQQFLSGVFQMRQQVFCRLHEVQLPSVSSSGCSFHHPHQTSVHIMRSSSYQQQFLLEAVPISSSSYKQQILSAAVPISSSSYQQQFLSAAVTISSSYY